METISIDVRATNVRVNPGYNGTFNLEADIDKRDIDCILDNMNKESIIDYLSTNGYSCELTYK